MDDLAKQVADLNRNIEKLIGLLSPPSATATGGGLHIYLHQVPPIAGAFNPRNPAPGTTWGPGINGRAGGGGCGNTYTT